MTNNERNLNSDQLAIRRLKAFRLQLFSLIDCAPSQVPPLPHCFGPPLFSVHFSLLTPLWVWVAPRCSFIYRLSSAAAVLYILRAERHNLRHKTMAAGTLLLAFLLSSAFCNLSCIEGETLQSHLFNHGLAVLPSPPENWIPAVVLCDVPVPDKSLTSLRACIWTQRAQLMLAFSGQSDCFCLQLLTVPLSACVFRFQKWKKKKTNLVCIILDLAECRTRALC